jgi:hypothetical protein
MLLIPVVYRMMRGQGFRAASTQNVESTIVR